MGGVVGEVRECFLDIYTRIVDREAGPENMATHKWSRINCRHGPAPDFAATDLAFRVVVGDKGPLSTGNEHSYRLSMVRDNPER